MAVQPKLDRLQSQLLNSGLVKENNSLFQVISQLIKSIKQLQEATIDQVNLISGTTTNLATKTFITHTTEVLTLPNSKRLIAGTNISFVESTNTKTINAIDLTPEPFITHTTPILLTNSKRLVAGTNVSFVDTTTTRTINTTTSPDVTAEPFIIHTTSGTLINSKRLIAGTNITFVDTTTTRTIVGSVTDLSSEPFITHTTASASLTNSKRLIAGTNITFVDTTTQRTINSAAIPADISAAPYLTHDTTSSLSNYRRLLAGTGISFDDTVASQRTVSLNVASPGAQVYRSTDLTISDATPTIITFTDELVDDNNYWTLATNPTRITVPDTAWYAIIGQATTDEANAGAFNVSLRLNGLTIRNGQTNATAALTADGLQKVTVAALLKLTAADYIELSTEINIAAATATIKGGQNNTFIQIVKVAVSAGGGGGGGDILTGTFAARPAAATDGRLYLPTDAFQVQRDDGSNWQSWGTLFKFTKPDDTGFSWVNQGTATLTVEKDSLLLNAPGLGPGGNFKIRIKSAPATPYTITAFLHGMIFAKRFNEYGLLFRNSANTKFTNFGILGVDHNYHILIQKWNNPTSFNSQYTVVAEGGSQISWFRIADDGVNRIYSLSYDGQHWIEILSVTRTDFLTADQIGFYVMPENISTPNMPVAVRVLSWQQS